MRSDLPINAANKKHRWSSNSDPLTSQISFYYTISMLSLRTFFKVKKRTKDRVLFESRHFKNESFKNIEV